MHLRMLALFWAGCAVSSAQTRDDFRIELTGSAWPLSASGAIQSGIAPVDIREDLGVRDLRVHFSGQARVRVTGRNILSVEGTSYRVEGENDVTRQFTFSGRTYAFADRVTSFAEVQYVSVMYERELIRNDRGSFTWGPGLAYIAAEGQIRSLGMGLSETVEQSFPIPLTGISFRVFPGGPARFGGVLRGLTLGPYGFLFQGDAHAGADLGRYVTILGGYRYAAADVHRRDETQGISLRFSGPIFSLQVRR